MMFDFKFERKNHRWVEAFEQTLLIKYDRPDLVLVVVFTFCVWPREHRNRRYVSQTEFCLPGACRHLRFSLHFHRAARGLSID